MDIFKASNSNELANLSQSPVNRIVRRPLTTIDEDSPIQKTTNKIQWDTRSTPLRAKDEHNSKRERPSKEIKPKVVKNFKRYKSSPQLINRDSDDDPEEKRKHLEHFRNLIMGGISSVKPRNLMENLDKSLNDSIAEGPLIEEGNAIKKLPSDDFYINFEDLDRIEAEEMDKNKKENIKDVKKSEDQNKPVKVEESLTDDDFGIDLADLERLEAEAMEKLKKEDEKKENFDDLLMVDSLIDWNAKAMACSTQFSQFKDEKSQSVLKPSTSKQVEAKNAPKLPPVFNNPPSTSKVIQPIKHLTIPPKKPSVMPVQFNKPSTVHIQSNKPSTTPVQSNKQSIIPTQRHKPSTLSNQPTASSSSSTSQASTLSEADKLRIERNRQEAMRRRQIFLENAKKRKI